MVAFVPLLVAKAAKGKIKLQFQMRSRHLQKKEKAPVRSKIAPLPPLTLLSQRCYRTVRFALLVLLAQSDTGKPPHTAHAFCSCGARLCLRSYVAIDWLRFSNRKTSFPIMKTSTHGSRIKKSYDFRGA